MKPLQFGKAKPPGKKRYAFFKYGFFVLLALHLASMYVHYDYWVFRKLITQHYIFTDALDTLYAETIGAENFRGYGRDFDRMVAGVVTQRIRAINQDRFTYLYTPAQYQAAREGTRTRAQAVFYEAVTDQAVHLFLPNISTGTRQFVLDNREALAPYRYLILDLRGNYGGMLADFHRIAELFVGRDAVLAHERTRWSIFSNTITARRDAFFNFEGIIILQNGRTASSAEGLIQALQYNLDNVTTVGTNTFGKGIGQVTIPMTGGYAVRATVMQLEGPDGESIHRVGLPPDILYEGEDMLGFALALLED